MLSYRQRPLREWVAFARQPGIVTIQAENRGVFRRFRDSVFRPRASITGGLYSVGFPITKTEPARDT
ncbi:MAG: hypothetical protein IIA14_09055 [SAR324 cluster bacterium]|nr:hypothetical protein [SAR324 cluster bacterium]